ncbi:heme ABC transporter ATP-binding protein [Saccharospirillum sp. MSK14-1]|uniref:heme ABC transporter ATP-binding protein n=1 Tax=Saccharospirillum sp. MSK14-1 TaxID=1897632 RepID=UPI000D35A270|nr:heme ABC transporter ATP-binding protein [Saccharospirillum sp. MSK14-1]PTY38624.1 heme ABC transporter ATP-binding protein [Saccharospirillum sp. MSK14-1]
MSLVGEHLRLQLAPGRIAIDDVSVQLNAGEVLALIGQNGAGKSSLLNLLSGEHVANAGQVRLHEKPITDWPGEDRARLLAVLPQQHSLNFAFRVAEVVALGRYPHGTGKRRDDAIVAEAMALCELSDLAQRNIHEISGGERQRVHLARVLAQIWDAQPEGHRFLLLDEPAASLDLHHQQMLFQAVRRFARRGVGVLLVVHDLNLAARYADRVLLLDHGRAVCTGRPADVLTIDTIYTHFGLSVTVQPHPHHDCPLIISH